MKGSVLYVGDSATDLLPLLDADCGVIIGDRYVCELDCIVAKALSEISCVCMPSYTTN